MEPEPTTKADESIALDPTPEELEAWAERERKRRAAWLPGPTEEERAAYAERVREQRLAELQGQDARLADRMRQMKLYPREAQLAAEGAMSLLRPVVAPGLRRARPRGRDWEEEVSSRTGAGASRSTTTTTLEMLDPRRDPGTRSRLAERSAVPARAGPPVAP